MQRSFAPPGRGRSLAGALTLSFALAACSSGTDTTSAPSSSPAVPASATPSSAPALTLPGGTATSATAGGGAAATKAPADPGAPRLDADALQGQAATIEGTSFDLGSLAGKDLVVWFWAPW